ncbi:MAG TPA: hypothetical protein VF551_02305, partial [Chthoniobacterales bacterium]
MQHPNDKIERSLIRIAAWTLGIIILLVAGGIFAHSSYRAWQERRLVAQANALVNEGNLKRASLDARRLLQINPDSAEGCRIMARISERGGARAAVEWRRRVVELAPGNVDDLIALARAAHRFDDPASRDFALSRLPEGAKASADYQALAADLAMARGDAAALEEHLREAVRLDPSRKENVLRLATLQLASTDDGKRAEGRKTLLEFQNDPATRREATRRLAQDAYVRRNHSDAVELARQLDSFPEKTFTDRLLLLSVLQAAGDSGVQALLEETKASSLQEPDRIGELISWMNSQQMQQDAIAWAAQLPPEVLGQKGVPIALSDSYIGARDWAGMLRIVSQGNWGSIDFIRSALA